MVHVWFADITPLLIEEIYQRYYQEAPAWRRKKADRYRHVGGRAQSIGAWSLWEQIRRRYGLSEETVYNLSHSGDHVLCAFSDSDGVKVGCDLEVMKEFREPVARRFFCRSEYEHIMEADEKDRARIFYRYWVLKESFIKATRRGMALDLRSFEIGWEKEGLPVLVRKPAEYQGEDYCYQEYAKEGVDAGIAVCTTDREIDAQLHILEL